MAARGWLIAVAFLLAGAVVLGLLVHPHVGSGTSCEGIGFGCTPERDMDTALIVVVYGVTALAALSIAWWLAHRGRPWRGALLVGAALTVAATAVAIWSQLPRYSASPGPLSAATAHWERVLADGRATAPGGTPLGNALRAIRRSGPLPCLDGYGRPTGLHRFEWSRPGTSGSYGLSSGARTAADLDRWARRLRAHGVAVVVRDPGGDPASDRRLRILGSAADDAGVLAVRASAYIAELEITASTGCHRS